MKIEFKVVRILDEYRIIINAGTNHGVDKYTFFEIHGVIDNVYDPDTQDLLGTLSGIKAKVYPVEIYEKMSICKNIEKLDVSLFSETMRTMAVMFAPEYLNMPKKLNVDKSQISNPELYEPIQIGDKAILSKLAKTPLPGTQKTKAKETTENSTPSNCPIETPATEE